MRRSAEIYPTNCQFAPALIPKLRTFDIRTYNWLSVGWSFYIFIPRLPEQSRSRTTKPAHPPPQPWRRQSVWRWGPWGWGRGWGRACSQCWAATLGTRSVGPGGSRQPRTGRTWQDWTGSPPTSRDLRGEGKSEFLPTKSWPIYHNIRYTALQTWLPLSDDGAQNLNSVSPACWYPTRGRNGDKVMGKVDKNINVGPVAEIIAILFTAVYESILQVSPHHVMAD